MIRISLIFLSFCLSASALPIEQDRWKTRYLAKWGPVEVQVNGTGRPPYAGRQDGTQAATLRSLVTEWQESPVNTACPCPLFARNFTVWSNGYVLPVGSKLAPVAHETAPKTCKKDSDCSSYCMNDPTKKPPYACHGSTGGGWEELYVQRELLHEVASALVNTSYGSESDYPWVMFATPGPTSPLTAASFSQLLGFEYEVKSMPELLKDKSLQQGLHKLDSKTLRAFQSSDKNICHGFEYIVNPTFVVAQRPDGTVIGVASTGIYT